MKATKKIIAEVTAKAIEMNCSVEKALSTLENCSKSIFDCIGAEGIVETALTKSQPIAFEIMIKSKDKMKLNF
jgi:hypothetical protein